MIDLNRLKRDVLKESAEDYVGLWSIIWRIRYELNDQEYPPREEDQADPVEVRCMTLGLVQDLLQDGLVRVGFPTLDGRGFEPWSLEPGEVTYRINLEWDALGREPNIGEVVWFTTTEKGTKEVQRISVEGA